jgi:hypothetical protein
MKIFAVLTVYGEILGGVADDVTDDTIETSGFIELARPLKLAVVPTPKGMMNTLMPLTQLMRCDILPIPMHHIVTFDEANPEVTKMYLQITSGIEIPGAATASKIQLAV